MEVCFHIVQDILKVEVLFMTHQLVFDSRSRHISLKFFMISSVVKFCVLNTAVSSFPEVKDGYRQTRHGTNSRTFQTTNIIKTA